MSRRRYLSTEISFDKAVHRLVIQGGEFAGLLYTWMIPHAEDDGSITADPEELMARVMPLRRDKTPEDAEEAIAIMVDPKMGLLTKEKGKLVFPPESFYKYQTYIPEEKRIDSQWGQGFHGKEVEVQVAIYEAIRSSGQFCGQAVSHVDRNVRCGSGIADMVLLLAAGKIIVEVKRLKLGNGALKQVLTYMKATKGCVGGIIIGTGLGPTIIKSDLMETGVAALVYDYYGNTKVVIPSEYFNESATFKFSPGSAISRRSMRFRAKQHISNVTASLSPSPSPSPSPSLSPSLSNTLALGFEEFWKVYPRKKSKGDAEKAWKALKPDTALTVRIVAAVQLAAKSPEWRKDGGQFIPYPATWLRARGWEDENSGNEVTSSAKPRRKVVPPADDGPPADPVEVKNVLDKLNRKFDERAPVMTEDDRRRELRAQAKKIAEPAKESEAG